MHFHFKLIAICALIICILSIKVNAQKLKDFYKPKPGQISLIPGFSTNGVNSGYYINTISINLLTGYSGGNKLFELGLISNFNETNVTGLQIAGIGNVVGGNAFNKFTSAEKLKWIQEGLKSNVTGLQIAGIANIIGGDELPRFQHRSDMTGVEISGFMNKVSGYVTGLQITGGFNFAEKGLLGVSFAGISNQCNDQVFGFQFAGLRNSAIKGIDGGQLSVLVNSTKESLIGYQISAFNFSKKINGRIIFPLSQTNFGIQLGLLNKTKVMNGYQVGIINIAGEMNGAQVGIINIFKDGAGTPIGLLNFGSGGHTRIYASELFLYNVEKATGNCTNCDNFPRPNNNRLIHSLIIGHNPQFFFNGTPRWGIGYGIGKSVYKWALPPYNEEWFYEYGLHLLHVNPEEKIQFPINPLVRIAASYGHRVNVKIQSFYLFGGLTFNYYVPENIEMFNMKRKNHFWPGIQMGIHLH